MPTVSELISGNISNAMTNFKAWGQVFYNVKEYIPKGDNTGDHTIAIQSAVNDAQNAGGGVVFFEDDDYTSGQIEVTAPNVKFLALGKATIKLKDNANTSLLWVKTGADNFECRGLVFDGNAENQTHTVNASTPFDTNSALVQVQCNNPLIEDVIIQNTKLRGLLVSAYTDGSNMIEKPVIRNVKTFKTGSAGISCVFARQPLIDGCSVSKTGGDFVKVTSVNAGTNTITTETPFTHTRNQKIACFQMVQGRPVFLGSIKKADNPQGVTSFTVQSLTLYGGNGTLSFMEDLYLLSADGTGNGIECSNTENARIVASHAEYTNLMGIAIVQDQGGNGIIESCTVKCAGEESFTLDGCRSGSLVGNSSEFGSVNADAPDIHVANASPGIVDAKGSSVIGNNSRNAQGSIIINAGLGGSFGSPQNTLIAANKIYRDPSFNLNATVAIQANGPASVIGNDAYHVDNGINIVDGDGSYVQGNRLYGMNAANSYGIKSTNAARTNINGNSIRRFTDATSVTVQGGYKITANDMEECFFGLNTSVPGTGTSYIGNASHVTTLFANQEPEVVSDDVHLVYKRKNDVTYARTEYINPVTFTPATSGYLRVIADGSFENPSEKVYRIWKWDNGSTPWLLSEVSATEVNPASISSSASINPSTGEITISVTGTGGGKALQYTFSALPMV